MHFSIAPPRFPVPETDHLKLSPELSFTGPFDIQFAATGWFHSPKTWEMVPFPQGKVALVSVNGLRRYVEDIRRWFVEWMETGSNAFFHPQLYRSRFPRCVQDAYSTLSCYMHKTARNEGFIFQLIEARAKQLVEDHDHDHDLLATGVDIFDHLSRVQALMVYQFMCLFDGDIRLRHVGEAHMHVLDNWRRQMVEHAGKAAWLDGIGMSAPHQQQTFGIGSEVDIYCSENALWYAWILAESIRRTSIIGSTIHSIYSSLQHAGPVGCRSSVMFTTRHGAWEAQSAKAWEKICMRVNLGLMQIAEIERVFDQLKPEDVNDFTKVFLEAVYGVEQVKEWRVSIHDQ